MSFAFVQDVAATWEQYARLASAIAVRPEGLLLHVAGPTDDGFRIIGLWESQSAWAQFAAELELEHAPTTFRALQPRHVVLGRAAAEERLDTLATTPVGSRHKLPCGGTQWGHHWGQRSGNDRSI